MREIIYFLLFAFTTIGNSFSQGISVGTWYAHYPFTNIIDLATTPTLIYGATENAVFAYSPDDKEYSVFTTINGLSDVDISAIEYSDNLKLLVITYKNANIDLIYSDNSIVNIADIKRKNIIGNKTINNVAIYGNYAWLSCGFGIIIVDLIKQEIKDTYYIGENGDDIEVFDIAFCADTVFAASEQGLYKAKLNYNNLSFFGNWEKMDKPDGECRYVECFQNNLVAAILKPNYHDDTLYYYNSGKWHNFENFDGGDIRGINISQNKMLVSGDMIVQGYNSNFERDYVIYNRYDNTHFFLQANAAVFFKGYDAAYVGTSYLGFYFVYTIDNSFSNISLNGPCSTDAFAVKYSGGVVATATGGYTNNFANIYRKPEFSYYHNNKWEYMANYDFKDDNDLFDIVSVIADPKDPTHLFAGSYSNGIYEIKNKKVINKYNGLNSPIAHTSFDSNRTDVMGFNYDKDGNLWIVTAKNNQFISVLKPNNEIKTFNFNASFFSGSDPVIDQNGYKWVAMPRDECVIVFNDNNTIDITSDDKYYKLTKAIGSGNLPHQRVYVIAVDKDNEIWLGTEEGIGVIYNPKNIFEGGNFDAQKIIVEANGYAGALMKSERVTAIVVDGANRKWIGTEKAGAFLVSEDGQEEIHHFTSQNSPLLSDKINGITINSENGEVFFATDNGIISFGGSATEPRKNLDSVFVFPNPVKSGYAGNVAINGLVDNSWASITDIYGTLIYRAKAFGGQAVWNCLDMNGNKPATGVYIVFITNADGTTTGTAKIMFYH